MNYLKIENCSLLNGDGVRVVLWVAGCEHHCKGCQNPETWNPQAGELFNENAEKRLFDLLKNSYISGLTISGGDPLFVANYQTVLTICKKVKTLLPTKTIWIWTGYTLEQLQTTKRDEIFKSIDYLIDGKYQGELPTSKKFRGSDNQKRYHFINGIPYFVD